MRVEFAAAWAFPGIRPLGRRTPFELTGVLRDVSEQYDLSLGSVPT